MAIQQTSTSSVAPLKRHSKYYIQDEDVTFLVEGQVFVCPRYLLEWESKAFASTHLRPSRNGSTLVTLPDVRACELAALLDYFTLRQSRQSITMPREHWLNLLSIATRFDFEDPKERAIRELQTCVPALDPVTQKELAGRYQIHQWLQPASCDPNTTEMEAEQWWTGADASTQMRKARL